MNGLTSQTLYELRDVTSYLQGRKQIWVERLLLVCSPLAISSPEFRAFHQLVTF
jgi:hypothetical protein